MDSFLVTVCGTRGSVPVAQNNRMAFGGNTSCYAASIGDRLLMLDCGTGVLGFSEGRPQAWPRRIDLLLSHIHLDHILGFPFFAPLFLRDGAVIIHSQERGGLSTEQQLSRFFSAPQWPVGPDSFRAHVRWHDFVCGQELDLGDGIRVSTLLSQHPNECTLYRIEALGKSLVYALDFEHGPDSSPKLARFARQCDLLIYDAQYTDEEYCAPGGPRGWGHSTWQEGVRLAKACGARRLLLSHHAPARTDAQLQTLQRAASARMEACSFAMEGQVITL